MAWHPTNRCRDCKHRWVPKLSFRSMACPECNSPHVRLGRRVWITLLLVTLVLVGGGLWLRGQLG